MGFGKKTDETSFERELRAQRPQPPSDFVRMLSCQIGPMQRTRRLVLPKVALIAAVTAALAASLGVAGALGSAGGSVHSFGISVVHLVSPPKATPVVRPFNTLASHTTTSTSSGAAPAHYPFQWQYGHQLAICWHGEIIHIPARELFYYLAHGARPPGLCLKWVPYPKP
jgi:hypothetical protein